MKAPGLISRLLQRWRPPQAVDAAPFIVPPSVVVEDAAPAPCFEIVAHIRGRGDAIATPDGWAGFATGAAWLEGFSVSSDAPGWRDHVSFQGILADKSLTAPVPGDGYCGTRGQMAPLHGFVLHQADDAPHLAALRVQGVFGDHFRSGLLAPGTPCVSPSHAVLLAMRITTDPDAADAPDGADVTGMNAPSPPSGIMAMPAETGFWDEGPPEISLVAHLAGRGDTPAGADGWSGNPDAPKHIEGFSAMCALPGWSRDVAYRAVQPDGSLGAAVQGGGYCGTRGKAQPLSGFMLEVVGDNKGLQGIAYEGVFQDGFRSGLLSGGQMCTSPLKAPLVAMRLVLADERTEDAAPGPEKIRMVIWDLDEVFWDGTLSEGGIVWREENAQIVRELAGRGIVSSICSKNDADEVDVVLKQHGMSDYFVFPSISWEPKGPRLAGLVDNVQLRATTVLFIDDNAMNRAEALSFVPGLQVQDENYVADLLRNPLLQGRPEPDLTRLARYHLMERRRADQVQNGKDIESFLKKSEIVVSFEYDIGPHLDRAVELINRTNQLNFTKARLPDHPDNPSAARDALRLLLSRHNIQAALVHVRDRYGDYGLCGFYVMQRDSVGKPELLHFAFSCRILGMGIETWLYRTLDRPVLRQSGKVASDPAGDERAIDWINTGSPDGTSNDAASGKSLSYVLLRGACELRPLAHYFVAVTDRVIEEFDTWRMGQMPLLNHSVIAAQALRGIDARVIDDAALLGYVAEDFRPFLAKPLPDGPAVWVLGFAIEQLAPMFRHNTTGVLLPWSPVGLTDAAAMMAGGPIGKADPAVVAHLRERFSLVGRRPNDELDNISKDSLRLLFSRPGADTPIFVVLANERQVRPDGSEGVHEPMRRFNALVSDVASAFPNVELLAPLAFMTPEEITAMKEPNHFDRIAYYRMFRHIVEKTAAR